MALRVRLLGRPSAVRDGLAVRGPRGRKAWALLAVLLLAERPMSRRSLAGLLFPDADDPLGALRWTLSELRRGLAGQVGAEGDPVRISIDPECSIDLAELLSHDDHEDRVWGPSELLLEGADGAAGADFDLWLTAARHRVTTVRAARLRRTADDSLANAEPARAVTAAAAAVAAEPYQPAARATLVDSLLAEGNHAAALAQLREWGAWIRRESRVSQLMNRSARPAGHGYRPDDAGIDAICRIEAGQAAMAAGAVMVGVAHLRDAVRLAAERDDERLQATALFALGGGLVHALAAHAAEGANALREAARLARRAGDAGLAAESLRDLAFVENTSGRIGSTRRLLSAAAAAAGADRRAESSVRAIEGMFLSDRGRHGRALQALRRSAELAESTGRFRQAVWSMSMASRSLLQQAEYEPAAEYAELCIRVAQEERWTAILPWMESILAELDLASGRVDEADRRLRHAWSLSLVLGDWCWQGLAARGLGLVAFARGDLPDATRWLDEAGRRAREDHDRYTWIHAWVQDALCRVTVAAELPRAAGDVQRLERIAAASVLPDFAVRAELHRAALGESSALSRAATLASTLDNPALVAAAGRRVSTRRQRSR
jgi:DNA-binding SARP family transcriptional activator